ncbi:MAG: hypothetical protein KJ042_00090 [Deltaproteobacteria bacterium]|nr:hypothetical protein [Deltaproteobacteria bacterium]
MRTAWIVIAVLGAAFVLDRLLLAAEARGWIYWRKKKASPGTAALAMLELESIVSPAKRHVIEQKRQEHAEEDDEGDPPTP